MAHGKSSPKVWYGEPGFKALAVEARVLAHYRGRLGEIARKEIIIDPISRKEMKEPASHGKTGFWGQPEGREGSQLAEKARGCIAL